MTTRGKIRNEKFASQLKDFSGLRFGKITPTDIDGFVEFGDKLYIFIEAKFNETKLQFGQKLALERLCDACTDSGKTTVLLIASHNTEIGNQIDIASLQVVEYRFNKKWMRPKESINVRQAIDKFRGSIL